MKGRDGDSMRDDALREIRVADDPDALARGAAEEIARIAVRTIEARGRMT